VLLRFVIRHVGQLVTLVAVVLVPMLPGSVGGDLIVALAFVREVEAVMLR
jgi:hypothetical protein